eukprot:4189445-Prymnesium_polylepis.4
MVPINEKDEPLLRTLLQQGGFDVVVVDFLSPAGIRAASAYQLPVVINLPSPGDDAVNKMPMLRTGYLAT